MKQVKFFLVALMAVVMGMSVTSCMNGDDNHNVTMTVPVKYNFGSFLMGDAQLRSWFQLQNWAFWMEICI